MRRRSALAVPLAVALPAMAQTSPLRLRVGFAVGYAPFSEVGSDGQLKGFEIDLAQALCNRLAMQCVPVMLDFDGLIPALQSRKIDGKTKTLSRFKSPPDVAGVALLSVSAPDGTTEELALYAPKVRRTRKIAAGSRGESFMESEFTYADFSGSSLEDASPTRGPDATNCKSCYVITATPKDSPYTKVEATIDKGNFMPVEVRYFDAQGLLKVYTVSKSEPKAGRNIATESVMENARTHRKSTLSVGQVSNADAPDAAFTDRGLERG